MKHYLDFQRTGLSFAERVGDPDEFHDALGRLVLGFALLEQKVCNAIHVALGTGAALSFIVTTPLSFRQRVELLGSVGRHCVEALLPPGNHVDSLERFEEILALCRRAEELRNTYVHSTYAPDHRSRTKRRATTRGLQTRVETIDAALLLDVADFISETAWICDEIPLVIGVADSAQGELGNLEYLRDGKVIARSLEPT